MLEKQQVPRKYYEMIEDMSYSKEEGYFIYLKERFINDVTGRRSIHREKISEVRRIISAPFGRVPHMKFMFQKIHGWILLGECMFLRRMNKYKRFTERLFCGRMKQTKINTDKEKP